MSAHFAPVLLAASPVLQSHPRVLQTLLRRGVRCEPLELEARDEWEDRLATALMSLWRDSRSPESFEALYAFAREGVLQWIKSLLVRGLCAQDAAEILQDTFINVFRYPNAFREDRSSSFRVWVRTIAGNLIRRHWQVRPRLTLQELPVGSQEPADRREEPFRRLQASEDERELAGAWVLFLLIYARAWSELGQRDRRTLHLVEVEELSYEEAGRILQVGRSNMKMIVFRARRRIASRMQAALLPPRTLASVA
jgi:RNA polymerase sigma-70 factor (ECF subfamily)